MGFRTKIDSSNNRQIIQKENTITSYSGRTDFGVPYNSLIGGPNLSDTNVLYELTGITSTFSGNTFSTVFNFGAYEMNGGELFLNTINTSNNNDDQIIDEPFFNGVNSSINPFTLQTVYEYYTGSTFDITITNFEEVSPSAYTGTLYTELVTVYSASTNDYFGDGVWSNVNGKLKTEEIIITKDPVNGYVLTAIDSSGNTAWMPSGIGVDGSPYFISGSTGTFSIKAINPTGLDAIGDYSFAIGDGVTASGSSSFASGLNTIAIGNASHAEGRQSVSVGDYSHAEGYFGVAFGIASHAEGLSQAIGDYSHAEGSDGYTSGFASHAEGQSTRANGFASHSEGRETSANGNYSHAEGYLTNSVGIASHAEGEGSQASGNTSHAEGASTTARGYASHAEGSNTIAYGDSSHAEGSTSEANGNYSHAEGYNTIANGVASHAEGNLSQAEGLHSHAEGYNTIASGNTSHAEGSNTIANGFYSHVEGDSSEANGNISHAEGYNTKANGDYSHSQGAFTIADNDWSFAGGHNTIAYGITSFVYGEDSQVNGDYSFVFGKGITGTSTNTTYVDNFNIKTLGVGASTADIGIDANGNVVNVVSDIRLKENITNIDNALEKVLNLRGVTYNWVDRFNGGDDLRMGFIAQEVKEVVPELVYNCSGNEYYGVHYSNTVALLVEAIKELSIKGVNTTIETQTIVAEDNNIELNYNGNHESAIGGGIIVINGIDENNNSSIKTNKNGDWEISPNIVLPNYTPTSSDDPKGNIGNICYDNEYYYIKTNEGWKRTSLNKF